MPPLAPSVRSRQSLDTLSAWALLASLVISVFVFVPSASVPFSATKASMLAVGVFVTLALYILARLTRGNIIFPSLTLIGALWLPTLAYLLSAVFSGTPFASALWGTALEPDTLGFMIITACFGTLAALVLRRPEHYRRFFQVGAYTLGAVVALQLLFVLGGQANATTFPPSFSILGSLNDLAFLLGLGVVLILLALRFLRLEQHARIALMIVGAAALFLLAITSSMLVWILIALVGLGLFVEAIMHRGKSSDEGDAIEEFLIDEMPSEAPEKAQSLVAPLVVLIVSLFFLINSSAGSAVASALKVQLLNVRPSWQSTLTVAEKTYAVAPIFGSGPGTFGVEWLKYRNASLNSTVFWSTDFGAGVGFVPTSFVTTGAIGAIAWIALLALFIVLGMRMLILRTPQDAFTRFVAIASFVGTLYLFAIAVFDLPGSVVLALAFVFAGLFVSTMRFASNGRQWGILFSRSPKIGFVVVFLLTILLLASVVAAYAAVERYSAAVALADASNALNSGNLDAADQSAQRSLSFASTPLAYQLQATIAAARLNAIVASTTMDKTTAQKAYQTTLSNGINAALTATRIAPTDYQNWLALGNLYAQAVPIGVSGAYASAKTAYDKAAALNPTNPQIPYTLAQLDIANKDPKAAEADLKQAISLKQDYTAAIFLLSQIEVQLGNVKGALSSALSAEYFTPNDPSILFQVGVLYAAQGDLTKAATALSGAISSNPNFANARYFLAAIYAKQKDYKSALSQLEYIAGLSTQNAQAVATQIKELKASRDPFPKNLLTISPTPVK